MRVGAQSAIKERVLGDLMNNNAYSMRTGGGFYNNPHVGLNLTKEERIIFEYKRVKSVVAFGVCCTAFSQFGYSIYSSSGFRCVWLVYECKKYRSSGGFPVRDMV